MDILDVLKSEHREVSEMLEEAKRAEPGAEELDDIALRIEAALTAHAQLEEKLFYPELRDRAEDQEERVDVFEAYTEHDLVKRLIELLQSPRRKDEQFKAQLQVLGENVSHHVREEESTIFGIAEKLLDKNERESLGERWERAKNRLVSAATRGRKGGRKKSGSRKTGSARKGGGARKSAGSRKTGGSRKRSGKK